MGGCKNAHNSFIVRDEDVCTDDITTVRNRYYGVENFVLQPQVCVYYDAWENDNDDDPVMSLVYTIMNSIDADFSFKSTDYIKAGVSIMEFFSGRSWGQIIDRLKGESPLDALKAHKDVEVLVGEFLDALIPEKGNRLVVFIDELDRCKPSYAVHLLERVKHYFSHDNITFVFSVNTNELQHTIKKYYGAGFDGSRYLDRLFDLRVTLPPPNLKRYFQSIGFNNGMYTFDIVCAAVIKAYGFELREIAKFIRLAKIAAYEPTHGGYSFSFNEGRALQFCLSCVVPVMIGLRVQNAKRYTDFVAGRDHSPLVEIVGQTELLGFSELLNRNETFDDRDPNKTTVTLEEKLKAVYEAIFATTYYESNRQYHTMIGNMEFTAQTKGVLMRISSLLSEYANFNVD